jgi:hypothetical protein
MPSDLRTYAQLFQRMKASGRGQKRFTCNALESAAGAGAMRLAWSVCTATVTIANGKCESKDRSHDGGMLLFPAASASRALLFVYLPRAHWHSTAAFYIDQCNKPFEPAQV